MQAVNSMDNTYSGQRLTRSVRHQQAELRTSDLGDSELSKSSRYLSETIPHVDSAKLRSTTMIPKTTTGDLESMAGSSHVSIKLAVLECHPSMYSFQLPSLCPETR